MLNDENFAPPENEYMKKLWQERIEKIERGEICAEEKLKIVAKIDASSVGLL